MGDQANGELLYSKACDLGELQSCMILGHFFDTGEHGYEVNRPRAQAMFEKACAGGHDPACARLAYGIANGYIDPPAPVAAFRFIKGRCEKLTSAAMTCFVLGRFYENGTGTSMNPVAAHAAYALACHRGASPACDELRDASRAR